MKNELPDDIRFLPLEFDVREREKVTDLLGNLPADWSEIAVLVNNAGNAHGLDPIQTGKAADWDAMIDINVKGLLYVSQAVIPGMTERKSGTIINIGSIAMDNVASPTFLTLGTLVQDETFSADAAAKDFTSPPFFCRTMSR